MKDRQFNRDMIFVLAVGPACYVALYLGLRFGDQIDAFCMKVAKAILI